MVELSVTSFVQPQLSKGRPKNFIVSLLWFSGLILMYLSKQFPFSHHLIVIPYVPKVMKLGSTHSFLVQGFDLFLTKSNLIFTLALILFLNECTEPEM